MNFGVLYGVPYTTLRNFANLVNSLQSSRRSPRGPADPAARDLLTFQRPGAIESGGMWIRLVAAAILLASGPPSLAQLSFDKAAIDHHRQIYDLSCVPSAVEMVLKLTGRVSAEYFELQEAWKNKADGSGRDFDAVSVAGLTFHQQFALPRKRGFPFKELFATIDAELS